MKMEIATVQIVNSTKEVTAKNQKASKIDT